jgi:hypothetical protein
MSRISTFGEAWLKDQRAFLADRGDRGPFDVDDATLVVLPSLTLPYDELRQVVGIQYYEERLLFLLLLLSRPRVRIIYLSSSTIDPEIVDYYLSFTPDPRDARGRLRLLALDDASHEARTSRQSLTGRILANAGMMEALRTRLTGVKDAYLLPFNVTEAEEDLAVRLGLPMYAAPADAAAYGSKSQGRRIARAAGVRVVEGTEDLRTAADVETAFAAIESVQDRRIAVVKLNDSFSGMGNVVVRDWWTPGAVEISSQRIWAVLPEPSLSWAEYLERLDRRGGVIERMISAPIAAPSVQMVCLPDHGPRVVSTHDQILGGMAQQVYIGCSFPADARYRPEIVEHATAVARELFDLGVVGLFGVDFIVRPTDNGDVVYFGEINLRLGGTTHPFGMCVAASGAEYDPTDGTLVADGRSVAYVASDNVQYKGHVGNSPANIINRLRTHELLYTRGAIRGITIHQMGSIGGSGKFGLCAIDESVDEAQMLFNEAVKVLEP